MVDAHHLDVRIKAVHVDKEIDSSIGKDCHASRMIGSRINMVDANGISPQIFHQRCITSTLIFVDEGIVGNKLIGNP